MLSPNQLQTPNSPSQETAESLRRAMDSLAAASRRYSSQNRSNPTSNSRQGTRRISQTNFSNIFQYRWPKLSKHQKAPQIQVQHPISLFFYADEKLKKAVKALQSLKHVSSSKFKKASEKVHRAQKLLLDTIYYIYTPMPNEIKSSRSYRFFLPIEDQRELDAGFSENILFAAQALKSGFRIRDIEDYTDTLREPARQLCAAFDALRFVFRERALTDPAPPYINVFASVLKDFDWAWTRFEQRICFCYFTSVMVAREEPIQEQNFDSGYDPQGVDEVEMLTILLSETILHGLKNHYFPKEDVLNYEPYLMFAVPRLSIVCGLLHTPDFIHLTEKGVSLRWFGKKFRELKSIQQNLQRLTFDQVNQLERMLVFTEDNLQKSTISLEKCWEELTNFQPIVDDSDKELSDDSDIYDDDKKDVAINVPSLPKRRHSIQMVPEFDDPNHLQYLFRAIASVADELQSGPRAKEIVFILGKVFKMHSLSEIETKEIPETPRETHFSDVGTISREDNPDENDTLWAQVMRQVNGFNYSDMRNVRSSTVNVPPPFPPNRRRRPIFGGSWL